MVINSKEELLIYRILTGIQRMKMRGGSWYTVSEDTRCAYQDSYHANNPDDIIGFRVLKVIK